jgi:hypothetical protein
MPHNIPNGIFIRDVVSCFLVVAGLLRRVVVALCEHADALCRLAVAFLHCTGTESDAAVCKVDDDATGSG